MARGLLIALTAGAALLALTVGGCGESPGPPEIGHASSGPITKQRVEEFARAVNLRAEDFPGAAVEGPDPDSSAIKRSEDELKRCDSEDGATNFVGPIDSGDFRYASNGEIATFTSSVQAAHTGAETSALVESLAREPGFACYRRAVRWGLEDAGSAEGRFLRLSFSKLDRPLPLGTAAVGIRIHAPFEAGMVEHDAYIDLITFSAGHAEVSLSAMGIPTPVSQDVEARLVSTLIERAEHHAL